MVGVPRPVPTAIGIAIGTGTATASGIAASVTEDFLMGSRSRDEGRWSGRDRDWDRERSYGSDRDYRPMTGDYGRVRPEFGQRGSGDYDRSDRDRSQSPWGRDPYPAPAGPGLPTTPTARGTTIRTTISWRDRHMSELDRDYDDYRRENQSRFENDFGSWREKRQQKRGLLGQIREHMEVVGNDDEHVGTVDKIAGDRIILTKSDPESGGAHHSLSCSDIDRVEGDKVILDCSATRRATAGATKAAAARCSSAKTRARWARACSTAASRAPIAKR